MVLSHSLLLIAVIGKPHSGDCRAGDLAILAVKEVVYRVPASFVGFTRSLAFLGVHVALGCWGRRFRGAAVRAVVGETGFVRLELELFSADGADFCWEKHVRSMILAHTVAVPPVLYFNRGICSNNLYIWQYELQERLLSRLRRELFGTRLYKPCDSDAPHRRWRRLVLPCRGHVGFAWYRSTFPQTGVSGWLRGWI